MPKGVPNQKTETKASKASITVTPTETFMGRTVRIATQGITGPLRLSGATQKWDIYLDPEGKARWSFMHPGDFELTSEDGASATITVAGGG